MLRRYGIQNIGIVFFMSRPFLRLKNIFHIFLLLNLFYLTLTPLLRTSPLKRLKVLRLYMDGDEGVRVYCYTPNIFDLNIKNTAPRIQSPAHK
jgi:hypothetical protein